MGFYIFYAPSSSLFLTPKRELKPVIHLSPGLTGLSLIRVNDLKKNDKRFFFTAELIYSAENQFLEKYLIKYCQRRGFIRRRKTWVRVCVWSLTQGDFALYLSRTQVRVNTNKFFNTQDRVSIDAGR
jgi:hypothetical protein